MLLKTILNRVQKQPGFVYGAVRFVEARGAVGVEVEIRRRVGLSSSRCGASRSSSATRCSGWSAGPVACGWKPSPGPRASTT